MDIATPLPVVRHSPAHVVLQLLPLLHQAVATPPPPQSARVVGGGEGGQGMEAIRREPPEVQKTSQEVGTHRWT